MTFFSRHRCISVLNSTLLKPVSTIQTSHVTLYMVHLIKFSPLSTRIASTKFLCLWGGSSGPNEPPGSALVIGIWWFIWLTNPLTCCHFYCSLHKTRLLTEIQGQRKRRRHLWKWNDGHRWYPTDRCNRSPIDLRSSLNLQLVSSLQWAESCLSCCIFLCKNLCWYKRKHVVGLQQYLLLNPLPFLCVTRSPLLIQLGSLKVCGRSVVTWS